jgi:hypothetical protein
MKEAFEILDVFLVAYTVASKKFWSSMSFQNLIRLSQIKKFPCLIMTMSTKCQKNEKKMTTNVINMIRGYDIYDRFTMEHFPLRQSMILTTSFFCSRHDVLA